MTKTKKRNKRGLFVLVFALILALSGGMASTFAALPDGEVVSTDTITGYYMDIELSKLKEAFCHSEKHTRPFGTAFARKDKSVTLIFSFPSVVYKERPVVVMGITTVNCPSNWTSLNGRYEFPKDVTINIRESFYNYFELCGGYNKVNITMFYNGHGSLLYTSKSGGNAFTLPVTVYEKDVPSDINDPSSPNFDLGDNGGLGTTDKDMNKGGFNLFGYIVESFNAVFNGAGNALNWVTVVLTFMAGLLVVGAVVAFLRLIKKLFLGL